MPVDVSRPMTTAGLQAKVRLRQAWFEAHLNQSMPEGRAQVERLFAAIEAEAAPPDSLDAAWAAAAAALPNGWEHLAVRMERDFGSDRWGYVATAGQFDDTVGGGGWSGSQATPAAALRALAARLQESK